MMGQNHSGETFQSHSVYDSMQLASAVSAQSLPQHWQFVSLG